VPRAASADRLPEVASAATKVFGRLGYKRTRTADVAAQAGVSTGGLFTCVDSKDALFHLVFVAGFGDLSTIDALPVRAPHFDETLTLIERGIRTKMALPRLRAAARQDDPADARDELTAIVTEYYRALSNTWPYLAVIERCAPDLPALEAMYFKKSRHGLIDVMERYVARRVASGHFRTNVDAPVDARFIVETVTWFGWHRHEDRDSGTYDDERALAAISRRIGDALLE
jgi:AcrR family transcriptional regulator